MPPAFRIGVISLALAFNCLACEPSTPDATGRCDARPVRMAVASSLREPAERLRADLLARKEPIDIELIFGASNTLARQLALGAPIDLLVSADAEIVADLIDRHLLVSNSAREFARGRLALVAYRGSFPETTGLDALSNTRLKRIAIPSPSVPLGRYATNWLRSHGRLEALAGRIVRTGDARATLAAVDSGHAELAIVYESDVPFAEHIVILARIDPKEHPPIRYVAARTSNAPSCDSIREVLDAWQDPTLQRRLARAGFLPARAEEVF